MERKASSAIASRKKVEPSLGDLHLIAKAEWFKLCDFFVFEWNAGKPTSHGLGENYM